MKMSRDTKQPPGPFGHHQVNDNTGCESQEEAGGIVPNSDER